MPFNPAQTKTTLKYEYPFIDVHEESARTFLMADDPYQVSTDERMRARWIEESKILYGSFTPSGP